MTALAEKHEDNMRTCTRCEQEKDLSDFEGTRKVCKECRKVYYQSHRLKHKAERNAYSRQYRQENPDVVKDNWQSYYERNKERLKARQKEKYRTNTVRHLLYAAKQRSEKFGFPFDINESDLVIPEKCPILGIPLEIGGRFKANSPSIDKIVPEKGYVKGNVAIMSFRANQIKGTATLTELKSLVNFLEGFAAKSLDTPPASVV